METSLLTVLPNLSIGVVSVLALAYVTLKHGGMQKTLQGEFMDALKDRADKHEEAMDRRETVIREVEAAIRNTLQEQLMKNTVAMVDVTKAIVDVTKMMERVSRHLEK